MRFRHVGHGVCVFIETIPELISNIHSFRHPLRKNSRSRFLLTAREEREEGTKCPVLKLVTCMKQQKYVVNSVFKK